VVRVVTFDKNYSIELCGGTHVPATGNIGYFKIISESAVAAGIRRIEAITANKVEEFVDQQNKTLDEIKTILKAPKELVKSVQHLVDENHNLQKLLQHLMKEKAQHVKKELLQRAFKKDELNIISEVVELDSAEELKNILFEIRNKLENVVCIVGAEIKGKPSVSVIISDNLVKDKQLNAGSIIKELAKEINGGGGGQAFYATAGGTKNEGLLLAIQKAKLLFN
jgi:alanyl-tRNA synthetase